MKKTKGKARNGAGLVDPERSAAMKGNKNAAGPHKDRGGARIGAAGSVIAGLPGAFAAGMVVGTTKGARGQKRSAKASGIVGALTGAAAGAAMTVASGDAGRIATGVGIGATVGGLSHYGANRGGARIIGGGSLKTPKPAVKKKKTK